MRQITAICADSRPSRAFVLLAGDPPPRAFRRRVTFRDRSWSWPRAHRRRSAWLRVVEHDGELYAE
jgi:hypothetical protein